MARIINTADFEPRTPNEEDWLYNGLDAAVTLEIINKLLPSLDNTTGATYAFSREMQGPILEMTLRGLLVDKRRRRQVLEKCCEEIATIGHQLDRIIRDGIGVRCAWGSTTDLKRLFYGVLGFKPIKKRKPDGTYSITVDREAIEKLSVNLRAEPLCNRLLLLRDLDKKRQRLEAPLDADGRERTNLNIAGTHTGRLASTISDFGTGGNQQNIDRDLREIYISDPGMKFANLDLEQADARNVGALCWEYFNDGKYLDACEGGDLHTFVCKMAWRNLEWPDDEKGQRVVADKIAYRQDSYRQLAKKLGHGTNFGGQPQTMAIHTKVDRKTIETFQRNYFSTFPALKQRLDRVDQELRDTSVITTLFGRRRIFFGRPEAGETKREAYAYEPQSMTAEEINRGLLQLWHHHRVWLHLQVHDSILIQYREEEEDEIIPWALQVMRVPLELKLGRTLVVPIDAKIGWNWGEFDAVKNPNGLVKWKGHDNRKRV